MNNIAIKNSTIVFIGDSSIYRLFSSITYVYIYIHIVHIYIYIYCESTSLQYLIESLAIHVLNLPGVFHVQQNLMGYRQHLRLREAKEWIEGGIHKCCGAITVYLVWARTSIEPGAHACRLGHHRPLLQSLSALFWKTLQPRLGGGSKKREERGVQVGRSCWKLPGGSV